MAYVAALVVSVALWVGAALWLLMAPAPLDSAPLPTIEVAKYRIELDQVDLEAELLF